jgi:putative spermidine/putrescine transport system substrate-binding protein
MKSRLSAMYATLAVALAVLSVTAGAATGSSRSAAKLPPLTHQLVYVGFGGSYQDAQDKAFFQPYDKFTNTKITEGTGNTIDRSKAEVQSGRPEYDLTVTNQANLQEGIDDGLWVPINYSYFRKQDLKNMDPQVRLKYGVGSIYYANGIVISTKSFPNGSTQPQTWADFWDTKKFPGKRALPACGLGVDPVPEAAELADGVSVSKIYPIDINRAINKLKELAPNVIFYNNVAQAATLVANGDAVMSMAANGRAQALIDQGAPLKIIWNQARRQFDTWYVLKGSPHVSDAMRFIAFASRPRQQAYLAAMTGYAPTNSLAYKYLTPGTAQKLVTYPANQKLTFLKNEQWWYKNRDAWNQACHAAFG